jgi:hypothetical protein
MRYGRLDVKFEEDCVTNTANLLPSAQTPFPSDATPQQHLRDIFYRMGFTDNEIVALR